MSKIRYRCCVPECMSFCLIGKQNKERFYRCPDPDRMSSVYLRRQAKLRLDAWRKVISEDLMPTGRICSKHFVSGRPAYLACTSDVDWIPTFLLPSKNTNGDPNEMHEMEGIHENVSVLRNSVASGDESTIHPSNTHPDPSTENNYDMSRPANDENDSCSSSELTLSCNGDDHISFDEQSQQLFDGNLPEQVDESFREKCKKRQTRNVSVQATPLIRSHFTQTESIQIRNDQDVQEIERLKRVIAVQNVEMEDLKKTIRRTKVDMQSLKDRPLDVKYYTGLDNYHVVEAIFRQIEPHMTAPLNLTKEQVFLMTLQKLRFDYFYKSLSISYEVCPATTSKYFLSTIYTLYKIFFNVVHWPSRDTLKKHTPQCFRDAFGDDTTIIIDCFEIRGQRSSNPIAAAQQWSDYKKGNTMKYLVGISPSGCVIFVSRGYGGRTSDKYISTDCGFLNHVSEGDVIMADRGFLIEEEIKKKNARLNIPAFKKYGPQLTALDVENTRKIANVRIHVERVIGMIREKYQLLKGHVPMTLIMRQHNGIMAMDMIVYVAAILVNICKPIIN
ncbi:uncharacterized protein LOC134223887 [Armigeres subalbatus]|uniref:uncharacterized protein LOC134223887 n=1 Tax=Armigeres subalbatus TaxID=124917 RepID=UPI002ED282C5